MAPNTETKRFSNVANNYPSYQDGLPMMLNSYRYTN